MSTKTEVDSTELNRAIAKAKGWKEWPEKDGIGFGWMRPSGERGQKILPNGSAWADSADVALAELWPDIVAVHELAEIWFDAEQGDVTNGKGISLLRESDADKPFILPIAICRAWLAMMEGKDE